MSTIAPITATTLTYADALARLPHDLLPAPLAGLWLQHAQAGAPMRDRADVLADTLAILALSLIHS